MHDIRAIRDNPAAFDAALKRRGLLRPSREELVAVFVKPFVTKQAQERALPKVETWNGTIAQLLLEIDVKWRKDTKRVESLQRGQKLLSEQAATAKRAGDEGLFAEAQKRARTNRKSIAFAERRLANYETARKFVLERIPNLPYDDVPDGPDETHNKEINRHGNIRNFAFTPKEHFQIPAAIPGLDFQTAAKLSGSRFVVLKGAIARLHRALAQFMIDTHVDQHGLFEMNTPVLVRNAAMEGTGQLPKFKEDSFFGASMAGREDNTKEVLKKFETPEDRKAIREGNSFAQVVPEILERAPTIEQFWLIPTAEVTLTNTVAGLTLEEVALPIQMVAHTLCFRSEAGSAGRDTAGMLRQHQFEKVEMVSITKPDQSDQEHKDMTKRAERILELLDLPYRTIELCTGDLGFSARRTHDLEVWLPGQNTFREISSVSVCGDFQARRMNARYRPDGGKPEFVHTLNGSGLAVGRTLIAVVENGQEEDGSITLPEVLFPYLGGKTMIAPDGTLC